MFNFCNYKNEGETGKNDEAGKKGKNETPIDFNKLKHYTYN